MDLIYSAYKSDGTVWLLNEKGQDFKAISTFDDSELIGYTQSSVSIKDSNGSIRVFNSNGEQVSQVNPVYTDKDESESYTDHYETQTSWKNYVAFAFTIGAFIFYYKVVIWISHVFSIEIGGACVIALIGTIIIAILLAILAILGYNMIKK